MSISVMSGRQKNISECNPYQRNGMKSRRKAAEERAADITVERKNRNIANKNRQKTEVAPLASSSSPAIAQAALPAEIPPPKTPVQIDIPSPPGKVLVASVNLWLIKNETDRNIDETHLKQICNEPGLGLEIVRSAGGNVVHFFASKYFDFDCLGSGRHPLCQSREILLARPDKDTLRYFYQNGLRHVSYSGKNLIFAKTNGNGRK